ncbi:MAG: hypothetical protein JWM54_1928 [Acidobacteriaceae bacterium]|jgi:hypothetical protein|nr:hypothetical protein [Acidobacteriaceae bacterium]
MLAPVRLRCDYDVRLCSARPTCPSGLRNIYRMRPIWDCHKQKFLRISSRS